MKKRIFAVCIAAVLAAAVFAVTEVKPKTVKYSVPGRSTATFYMTEIYAAEFWAEFYLTYEENNDVYDEAEAEKAIYEFISMYKVEHKFSLVEVEELKAATIGKKNTTVLKRIIFRQVRK